MFDRVEVLAGCDEAAVRDALGALADDANANATLRAIGAAFPAPDGLVADRGDPVLVGPQVERRPLRGPRNVGDRCARDDPGRRARRPGPAARPTSSRRRAGGSCCWRRPTASRSGRRLPAGVRPSALVLLAEKVRPDAGETLRYFDEQGVALKVISGDNPRTVGAVAREVGLPGAGDAVDARTLPEDRDELAEVLEHHSVFGRVTPQQKRAIVGALQSRGHVVAMTGDGVNDALALKDADIGIAMGSGAAATRAVAQLVLLDNKFSTMPGVVAEGRRVIANIERSANLFVTKTVYADPDRALRRARRPGTTRSCRASSRSSARSRSASRGSSSRSRRTSSATSPASSSVSCGSRSRPASSPVRRHS